MFDFTNKNITILGAARSGIAVARLLLKKKAKVWISDNQKKPSLYKELLKLKKLGVKIETGRHSPLIIKQADFIIVSPGVDSHLSLIEEARRRGSTVLSEIEVASQYLKGLLIAVTGTNGKTTTTSLIGEIFKNAGDKTQVCGNIGNPISNIVSQTDDKTITVAEISSFQLENIHCFHPNLSVILNITPDHLDRYQNMRQYIGAKKRIFENQTKNDFIVLNADDRECLKLIKTKLRPQVILFSTQKILRKGLYVQNGNIYSGGQKKPSVICHSQDIKIPGPHNLENALAAIGVALICKMPIPVIKSTLRTFSGVEHRLESVREYRGVRFVNDSKATNVDSVVKALQSFNRPIILIAGGRDKGSPYKPLKKLVRQKVKALVLLGEASPKIKAQLGQDAPVHMVKNLAEAVKTSFKLAHKNDLVLLSPACASFDMFKNYEERGKIFKQMVKNLK